MCELCLEAVNAVRVVRALEAAVVNPNIKFSTWRFYNSKNPNTCQKCEDYDGDEYELEDPDDLLIFSHTGNLSLMILSPAMFTRTAHATVLSNQIIKKVKENGDQAMTI